MKRYTHKGTVVAIHIQELKEGSIPQTQATEPLQVVSLKHKSGKHLQAHMHQPKLRKTYSMQEGLIIKKGSIKVSLFSPDKVKFKDVIIKKGEMLILMNGGYAINFLENSEIFEVKNGPFVEDKVLI